jgi:hypothetical protein
MPAVGLHGPASGPHERWRLEGLSPGDKVAIDGLDRLLDGTQVRELQHKAISSCLRARRPRPPNVRTRHAMAPAVLGCGQTPPFKASILVSTGPY